MSEDNFASGLWEYQEHPPTTLICDHCDGKTEYVFTWVWKNLTKQEFQEATAGLEDLEDCWIAIQAKLKEKNVCSQN